MAEGHHGFAYVIYRGDPITGKMSQWDAEPGDVLLAHITDPHGERRCYKVEAPYGVSRQRTFFYESKDEMEQAWEIVY